jgi:hypothetical protein
MKQLWSNKNGIPSRGFSLELALQPKGRGNHDLVSAESQ